MKDEESMAERVLYAVDRDGRGFDIGLQIGRPHQVEDSPYHDWACEVSLIGLHKKPIRLFGVDSWQALLLALSVVRHMLTAFVEYDGGKLYSEKGGRLLTVDEAFGVDVKEPDGPPAPDGPLNKEQQERCDQLTAEHIQKIDDALIANCSKQWRKVARVVGTSMSDTRDSIPNVPDIFYASRVRHLVDRGHLLADGNLDYMRFSEVKLPDL